MLYTLLLSLCCFAVTLQSHATGVPAKKEHVSNEYHSYRQTIPGEALNDYFHISPAAAASHACQKDVAVYFTGNSNKAVKGYILNDCCQNSCLIFSGTYAKTFRIKLIFPQHYHW